MDFFDYLSVSSQQDRLSQAVATNTIDKFLRENFFLINLVLFLFCKICPSNPKYISKY